ncbi:hypothetical protein JXD38_10130 [candidate division WOR-3 bacterium]|nr:hypothetical protein [candidate division WOR-3 bacterium]
MAVLDADLREGRSLVLLTPDVIPLGLWDEIRRRAEGFCHWMQLEPGDRDPVDAISAGFGGSLPPTGVNDLYDAEGFCGKLFVVDRLPEDRWPLWRDFLLRFSVISRARSELNRSAFLVRLSTERLEPALADDVLLGARKLDGQVTAADAYVYSYQLHSTDGRDRLVRDLKVALCTELALWDLALCRRLSELTLDELARPQSVLQDYAKNIGWAALGRDVEDCDLWKIGAAQDYEGRRMTHSAYLTVCGENEEIERRVWKAELKVLFPFVEEQRQRIIRSFGHHLRLPYLLESGGSVDEPLELEIAHLRAQLGNNPDIRLPVRRAVSCLADVRNDLAHLRPVNIQHVQKGWLRFE